MPTQDEILRACDHSDRQRAETNMGHGEIIPVCCDCWNASVQARRRDRKIQLAEYWAEHRTKQAEVMRKAGAEVGQRVQYFAPSMLGGFFGGITYKGTIRRNRNGVAYVQLDQASNGKRSTVWHVAWRPIS
jgi:hypothetical protein